MSLSPLFLMAGAFLISTALGYGLCVLLLPVDLSRRLSWAIAAGVGAGISSFVFFVFRRPMATIEVALLIVAIALVYRRGPLTDLRPMQWKPSLPGIFLCAAMGLGLGGLALGVERMPHGGWDGWAIWNTHARLLYRVGPAWKNEIQYTFHGDYPLLTPTLAARFWRYADQEVPEAGALVGVTLGLSSVALLAAALSVLRDLRLAVVMGFALLGTPKYLELAAVQYADVPLSFYILTTLVLICLHSERARGEKSILALAGFTAGCAGWTKNEGVLFIAAVSASLLAPVIFRRAKLSHRFMPFLAGLLIPLAVIVAFKLTVPVQNDLIEGQHLDAVFERITDPDRYLTTLVYFLRHLGTFGTWFVGPFIPIVVFVGARGIDRAILRSTGWRSACLIQGLVLAGYFAVYINTPLNLQDHLESSLDRLLVHLWPSFLLLLGLTARSENFQAAVNPDPSV